MNQRDERATFGFNTSGHCLVGVLMVHYLRMRLVYKMYNYYAIPHAYNTANTNTQGSDWFR